MSAKRSIKSYLGKILIGAILLMLFVVSVPLISLVSIAFMWDSNCGESSRPVALARSLTQQQLADLNRRVMDLSKDHPDVQLTNSTKPLIPDDLKYLNARYISFERRPYIVLAKCNVSVGVTLRFEPSRSGEETIMLSWYAPTDENPYTDKSEVLWTAGHSD